MFALIIALVVIAFVLAVTLTSYKLGKTKTENPKLAAMTGFLLCFLPPLALIYLVVLLFKEDAATV